MPKTKIIKIKGYECQKCKFQWLARVDKPKLCPNCKGRLKM